jgi:hypothetical protein
VLPDALADRAETAETEREDRKGAHRRINSWARSPLAAPYRRAAGRYWSGGGE